MIELLWPWAWLLLPLPFVARWLLPKAAEGDAALRAPFFAAWASLQEGPASRARQGWAQVLLLWLVWLCLLAGLSRPTWIGEPIQLPNSGRDLMLAVDISGSMRVEDMQVGQQLVRRIDAVKAVGAEFIERRRGDRLGLILFGSNAYVQSPLSFDVATVERFLREAQIGFAGQETAIGDAVGLAVKRLQERPAESRVLVLLTDGRDTASSVDPLEAARLSADLGIKIYTIGIGADEITIPGVLGSRFGQRQVNPSAELDEQALTEMAGMTGGRYFRARDPAELAGIYQLLDELEPVEQSTALYRPRHSLSHWAFLAGLLCSGLLWLGRTANGLEYRLRERSA